MSVGGTDTSLLQTRQSTAGFVSSTGEVAFAFALGGPGGWAAGFGVAAAAPLSLGWFEGFGGGFFGWGCFGAGWAAGLDVACAAGLGAD